MSLTERQWQFIRDFSMVDAAMPRAMGLLLGYLLVCEPKEQTAPVLQQELGLSAGSVSTMMSMLVDSGLVSKVKKPGDRKYYYMVGEGSWQRTVEMRLASIKKVRALVAKGKAASPGNYRMKEVFQIYDFLVDDLEKMITRLNDQKLRVK